MNFNDNLKRYREQAGFTRKEMAQRLGVSVQGYSYWETKDREPNYETLVKIAQILNVSTDNLLGVKLDDYTFYKSIVDGFQDASGLHEDEPGKVIVYLDVPPVEFYKGLRMTHDEFVSMCETVDRSKGFLHGFRDRFMILYALSVAQNCDVGKVCDMWQDTMPDEIFEQDM